MNQKLYLSLEDTRKLLDAKTTYGQLFRFDIDDTLIISRPLLIIESETISSFAEIVMDNLLEDWIFEKTTVYCNKNIDSIKAGLIPVVVSKILKISNVQDESGFNKAVLGARSKASTIQSNIESLICRAFPQIGPTGVKNMTQAQQMNILARSEIMLGQKLEVGTKSRKNRVNPMPGYSVIEAKDITSKEAADKPDFERDNREMSG